jgi:subtilase family serine protease/V8-like Glu-specific endopeptidase
MRRWFALQSVVAAVLTLSGGTPAWAQQEEESEQQRLLEILRNAKPAPVGRGKHFTPVESLSPEQLQSAYKDLATGEEMTGPALHGPGFGSIPVDLPFRPSEVPVGSGREGLDGDDALFQAAITPPAPLLNTTVFPWNTIYKMLMRFRVGTTDYYYVCSASSTGDFHLLTAGHCIYNWDPNDNGNESDARWADEVWVWAAQTDRVDPFNVPDRPYGEAKGVYIRSYTGWTQNHNYDHDWGVVTLDRRMGSRTGWMGRETDETDSLNFSGYPTETPYVPAGELRQYPGFDANNVRDYTSGRIELDALIYGGHSGGPEWRYDGTNRYIEGINSTSNRVGYAEGTYLTNGKRSDLNSYMSDDATARPPVARPELIEYLFDTTSKDLLTNSAKQGQSFSVEYNVLNVGFVSTGTVTVNFYLSTNTTISTGDTLLGTRTLGSLAAYTFSNPTTSFTVPVNQTPGNYYVGWIMSSAVAEYTTSDSNAVIADETLNVQAAPDLQMSALDAPATAHPGDAVNVSNTVWNAGGASAGSFRVGLYLSADSVCTTADTFLAFRTVASLAANATSVASTPVTIPPSTPLGSRYMCAIADYLGAVVEKIETNNTRSDLMNIVGLPDLQMTALTPPGSANPSQTVNVSNTVQNSGQVAASNVRVGLYLSSDTVCTTGDTFLASRVVASLGVGGSSTAATPVTIPGNTPLGTRYVCAIADDLAAITESNETNNTRFATIQILSLPDLTVSALSAPSPVSPGAPINVTNTVMNGGQTASGNFRVGIYQSADNVCSTTDTLLASRTLSLGAGASSTAATPVVIPAASVLGPQFLCAIADDLSAVTESNEGNNTRSAPIDVLSAIPIVNLKINGMDTPVVTTPDVVKLTLGISPTTYTASLDWYYAIIGGGGVFWVTSTGLSTTPAPLLNSPPLVLNDVAILDTTLPPGTWTFAFFLLNGGSVVSSDFITANVTAP